MIYANSRRTLVAVAAIALFQICSGGVAVAAVDVPTINYVADLPKIKYHVDDWLQLPPGRKWGPVTAIELAPDGKSIWVVDRCVEIGDCSAMVPDPIQR